MTNRIKRHSTRYGRFRLERIAGETCLRVYLSHTNTLIGEIPYSVASKIKQAVELMDAVEEPLNLHIYRMMVYRSQPGSLRYEPLNQGFGEKGSMAKIKKACEAAGVALIKGAA